MTINLAMSEFSSEVKVSIKKSFLRLPLLLKKHQLLEQND